MGTPASRALLLKGLEANAKVDDKYQIILRVLLTVRVNLISTPPTGFFKMHCASHAALSGYPGHSPTPEESDPHPGFNTFATG